MDPLATEITANSSAPMRIDLSGAYLVVLEVVTATARLSFEQGGFQTTSSYRVMDIGSALALDLPRPANLNLWVRADSADTVMRVLVFR